MLGFNVTISKLKTQPTRELLLEAKSRSYSGGIDYLYDTLTGERVGYIDHVWDGPFPRSGPVPLLEEVDSIAEKVIEAGFENEDSADASNVPQLLMGGGYPSIFTAFGRELLSAFAEKHADKLTAVEPDILYLVKMWDLS